MPPSNHNLLNLPASTSSPPTNLNSRSEHHLQRRWSSCSYYDTSCSTHRTILLAIIIAVCALCLLILTLLYLRHHRRRVIQRRATQIRQANTIRQMRHTYGVTDTQYYSRGDDALRDGGLEAPPPAYTKDSREGLAVR